MAADNNFVKKPFLQHNFTNDEIREYEKCMDPLTGPLYFCKNYVKVQHPTRGATPFIPFEFQERMITAFASHRNTICLLPRQCGKCVINQSLIKVKHKISGEEYEIPVGDFFNLQKTVKK